MPRLRELVVEKLEAAQYPVSDTEVIERPDDTAEIAAVLTRTSVSAKELDAVLAALSSQPGVRHATWETKTAG